MRSTMKIKEQQARAMSMQVGAITALCQQGFDRELVVRAVTSGDLSQLAQTPVDA